VNAHCKSKNRISKYKRTSLTHMSAVNYTIQKETVVPYYENFLYHWKSSCEKNTSFQLNPFTMLFLSF